MPNLGDRLREAERKRGEAKSIQAIKDAELAAKRVAAQTPEVEATIRKALLDGRTTMISAIVAGNKPPEFMIPLSSRFIDDQWAVDIMEPKSKLNHLYAAFERWAHDEGLDVHADRRVNGIWLNVTAAPSQE